MMKHLLPTYQYLQLENNTSPNLVLLSKQVDGLREVLRRMKASQSSSIDNVINEKLNQISQSR